MALGEVLKAARESKNLTVSEVAVITRMTSQIVSEIEKEDFHRFTAGLYWRSYIRLYAETMSVDPEPLIEDFVTIFENKTAEKPLEQKPKPVKKRDYNIFPTGETALQKIGKKKKFSENVGDCKEKLDKFNEKAVPIIKNIFEKFIIIAKQLAGKIGVLFSNLKRANPTYLYGSLGLVVLLIATTIAISSFKSYRKEHPKAIKQVIVTEIRAGIEAPEPYFDTTE